MVKASAGQPHLLFLDFVCMCVPVHMKKREREAVHCFVSLNCCYCIVIMALKEFITEMFVIIPLWYSLQKSNIVSLMTEWEIRVGRRVPSREGIESLLNMCLCTHIWALQFLLSQVWSKPPPAVCAVLLSLHSSPGQSDHNHPFHGWAFCSLRKKSCSPWLQLPSAAKRQSAGTQMSSANVISDKPPHSFLTWAACASQLSMWAYLHPVTFCCCPLTGFLCLPFKLQKVQRDEQKSN